MNTPNKYRLRKGVLASTDDMGANGFFVIPHPRIDGYFINCMVSDGSGWDHVSVTISSKFRRVERCPTWEEMCFVKDTFWNKDEIVIQYHPAEADYISNHNYCLHLWRPQGVVLPTPDPIMVGVKF